MIVSILIITTIIYTILIGSLAFGIEKVKRFELKNLKSKTNFSVIIPFRNEAKNLEALLDSILQLNYPKNLFEIIFIDDESDDNSVELITEFINKNPFESTQIDISIIKNIRTTNSPKKDAITIAIKNAKYNWIVTTDADCKLPKYWLDSFDEFIQNNNTDFIVAPVTYSNTQTFLERFQLLDILSLQGVTIGGFGIKKPFLCNGANLAYKTSVFKTLNGFDGNTTIASGDDIFLLEKAIKNNKNKVHYLKSEHSIVTTKALPTLKSLIAQRLRWAAKTTAYNNWFGKLCGLIVLLMNTSIIIGLVLIFINVITVKTVFYILFIKFNIDLLLLYKSVTFYNQKSALKYYVFSFFIYPFFSVYIAFISTFKSYKWKGRTFNK
jgi:cellulose synthase/poly-beta-1,6-N-acetylglucosamine synthase-like glycosyltransferase